MADVEYRNRVDVKWHRDFKSTLLQSVVGGSGVAGGAVLTLGAIEDLTATCAAVCNAQAGQLATGVVEVLGSSSIVASATASTLTLGIVEPLSSSISFQSVVDGFINLGIAVDLTSTAACVTTVAATIEMGVEELLASTSANAAAVASELTIGFNELMTAPADAVVATSGLLSLGIVEVLASSSTTSATTAAELTLGVTESLSGHCTCGFAATVVLTIGASEELSVTHTSYSPGILLHMDGVDDGTTFTDSGGSGHIVTRLGDTVTKTGVKKFGTASAYFDGDGDRLEVPNHSDFDFGTGSFTIDMWIYPTSLGTYRDILCRRAIASNNSPFIIQHGATNSDLNFGYADENGDWVFSNKNIGTIATGNWYHVAVVRDGANWYTFLNGVAGDTWTDGTTSLWENNEKLWVGGVPPGTGTPYFNGYVDEVRILKGEAVWTSGFSVPTSPHDASVEVDTIAVQSATTGNLATGIIEVLSSTIANTSITTADLGLGVSEDLSSPASVTSTVSTSELIIGITEVLTSTAAAVTTTSALLVVGIIEILASTVVNQSVADAELTIGADVILSSTINLVTTFDGFIQLGTTEGLSSSISFTSVTSSPSLDIGIVEILSTTNAVQSAADATISFGVSESMSHTLTSGTGGLDSYTKLLLHANGDVGNTGHNLTQNGNPRTFNTEKVFGDSSCQLDGSQDYWQAAHHADWNLGSGNFVLESRLNFVSPGTGTDQQIIARYDGSGNNRNWRWFWSNNNNIYFQWSLDGASGNSRTWSFTPTWGQWYHIAIVRSGSNLYCYIDGVRQTTQSITGTIYHSNTPTYIGCRVDAGSAGQFLRAYLDETRISTGTDRGWTGSTITVPTEAYTSDSNTKLLVHWDGDASESGHTIRWVSGENMVKSANHGAGANFEGSYYFDGSGNHLPFLASDDWNLSNSDFVVDFHIDFDTFSGSGQTFCGRYHNVGNQRGWACYYHSSSNILRFGWSTTGSDWSNVSWSWTPTPGQFYHVAFVRSGNTMYCYIDGVRQDAGQTFTGTVYNNSSEYMYVGALYYNSATSDHLKGYLDELRISVGTDRGWTGSTITVPTSPYDEITLDSFVVSNVANTFTVGHVELLSTTVPLVSSVVGGTLDTGQGEVLSSTINVQSAVDGNIILGITEVLASSITAQSVVDALLALGVVEVLASTSVNASVVDADMTIGADQELTSGPLVQSDTFATMTMGVSEAMTGTTSPTSAASAVLFLGVTEILGSSTSTSSTTEADLTIGVTEVLEHTMVTGVGGNDSNTLLLLHMDDTSFTDSAQYSLPTSASGTVSRSSDESKFGGYSASFSSGYIDTSSSSIFEVGTGDFTVDCWVNTTVNSLDTYYRRIFMWDGATGNANNNPQLSIVPTSGVVNAWSNTGSLDIYSTTAIDDGDWHHIAMVRSSGTVYLFIDGQSEANQSYTENVNISSPSPRVGSYSLANGNWSGYIDEVRMSDKARWVVNFTPPSLAYGSSSTQWLAQSTTSGEITLGASEGLSATTNVISTTSGLLALGVVEILASTAASSVTSTPPLLTLGKIEEVSGPCAATTTTSGLLSIGIVEILASTSITTATATANLGFGQAEPLAHTLFGDVITGGNDEYTKLLLHFDADDGNTTHNFSNSGNVKLDASTTKFGSGSYYFDGSSYLSVPDHADWNFGTGDFVIDTWINTSGGSTQTIVGQDANGGNDIWHWKIKSDDTLQFGIRNGGSWDFIFNPSGTSIATDTWCHVAIVRSGTTWNMYIDGTRVGQTTNSISVINPSNPLKVGRVFGESDFSGNMDEFRISVGTNRGWTGTSFSVPTVPWTSDSYTKLLLHMNADDSGSDHDATMYGNVTGNPDTSKWNGSFYFDGSGDHIRIPTSTDFDLTGQNDSWTIDFWANANSAATNQHLFSIGAGISGLIIQIDTTGGYLQVVGGDGAAFELNVKDTVAFPTSQWVHVAVVNNAGTVTLYKNGTSVGTPDTLTKDLSFSSNDVTIGIHASDYSSAPFAGYLDELRISKGVARWTSNFNTELPSSPYDDSTEQQVSSWLAQSVVAGDVTLGVTEVCTSECVCVVSTSAPTLNTGVVEVLGASNTLTSVVNAELELGIPVSLSFDGTGPYPLDDDAILLLHMDDSGLSDSSYSSQTVNGNANVVRSTTVKRYGLGSARFPGGANDYISISDDADFSFGSGDFTIEGLFWVEDAPSSGFKIYHHKNTSTDDHVSCSFRVTGGDPQLRFQIRQGGGIVMDVSGTLTGFTYNNSWERFAFVRSGTNWYIYWNGTRIANDSSWNGTLSEHDSDVFIGRDVVAGGDVFDGWLDEYRVTPTARYTGASYTHNIPFVTSFAESTATLGVIELMASTSGYGNGAQAETTTIGNLSEGIVEILAATSAIAGVTDQAILTIGIDEELTTSPLVQSSTSAVLTLGVDEYLTGTATCHVNNFGQPQQYTAATEEDTPGSITPYVKDADFVLNRNNDAYLYWDFGVDYFDGNFEHRFDFQINSNSSGVARGCLWMLANNIDDAYTIQENYDSLSLYVICNSPFDTVYLYLAESVNGTVYESSYPLNPDTRYYVRVYRSGSTLYRRIYSDPNYTNLVHATSRALHETEQFRYLYQPSSMNLGAVSSRTMKGNISNLALESGSPLTFGITESIASTAACQSVVNASLDIGAAEILTSTATCQSTTSGLLTSGVIEVLTGSTTIQSDVAVAILSLGAPAELTASASIQSNAVIDLTIGHVEAMAAAVNWQSVTTADTPLLGVVEDLATTTDTVVQVQATLSLGSATVLSGTATCQSDTDSFITLGVEEQLSSTVGGVAQCSATATLGVPYALTSGCVVQSSVDADLFIGAFELVTGSTGATSTVTGLLSLGVVEVLAGTGPIISVTAAELTLGVSEPLAHTVTVDHAVSSASGDLSLGAATDVSATSGAVSSTAALLSLGIVEILASTAVTASVVDAELTLGITEELAHTVSGVGNDSYTKLLLHMEDTALSDSSLSGHSITKINQADRSGTQKKFGDYSCVFDGTGDYLQAGDSDDWAFGTDDFVLDCQVYFSSTAGDSDFFRHWQSPNDRGFQFSWLNADSKLYFWWTTDGSTTKSNGGVSWSPNTGQWYHVAAIRSGSDLKIFVDGSQVGSTHNIGSDSIPNVGATMWVSGTNSLNGYIDEARISVGTDRGWASGFTAPTEAYGVASYAVSSVTGELTLGIDVSLTGTTSSTSEADALLSLGIVEVLGASNTTTSVVNAELTLGVSEGLSSSISTTSSVPDTGLILGVSELLASTTATTAAIAAEITLGVGYYISGPADCVSNVEATLFFGVTELVASTVPIVSVVGDASLETGLTEILGSAIVAQSVADAWLYQGIEEVLTASINVVTVFGGPLSNIEIHMAMQKRHQMEHGLPRFRGGNTSPAPEVE